jgi:hypothetical protein
MRWLLVLDTDLVVARVKSARGSVSAQGSVGMQSLGELAPLLMLWHKDSSLVQAGLSGLGSCPSLNSGGKVTADAVARFATAIFEAKGRAQ